MNRATALAALLLLAGGCANEPKYGLRPAPPPRGFEADDACADLKPLRRVLPTYPRLAQSYDQEGWVALKYNVAADGVVFNVRAVHSSPEGIFEQASVAALVRWRYPPMTYPVRNCSQLDIYQLQ